MNKRAVWTRRFGALAAGSALTLGLVAAQSGGAGAQSSGAASAASGSGVTNPYSPAYGHPYRHGVVPTREQQALMNAWAASHTSTTTSTGPETLSYGGGIGGVGVTSGTPQIYLVFWGSQWGSQTAAGSGDPNGAATYLQNLFKGLGTNNELWSGTMTQYCDGSVATGSTTCPSGSSHVLYPTGGALAGVWFDNAAAAPSSATSSQLAQEAVNAANHFASIAAPTANYRYAQFDVLSPSGANPDNWLNSRYCAWHDFTGDGYGVTSTWGNLAFSNMPYVTDVGASCGENFVNSNGTLDGFSIVNGHEYAETVTDQFPAGGWTNHQAGTYNGEENGDECAWISSGTGAAFDLSLGTFGSFAMQSTWSNDTNACAISHPIFTGSTTGGTTNTVTVSVPSPTETSKFKVAISTVTVTAKDSVSGQPLSWSVNGLPPGLKWTAAASPSWSGTITGTPNRKGTYNVSITASDGTGASGSASITWTVS